LIRCLYETKFNGFIRERPRARLSLCPSASQRNRSGQFTAEFGQQHAIERGAKYFEHAVGPKLGTGAIISRDAVFDGRDAARFRFNVYAVKLKLDA
jgi:hypothetical protein